MFCHDETELCKKVIYGVDFIKINLGCIRRKYICSHNSSVLALIGNGAMVNSGFASFLGSAF